MLLGRFFSHKLNATEKRLWCHLKTNSGFIFKTQFDSNKEKFNNNCFFILMSLCAYKWTFYALPALFNVHLCCVMETLPFFIQLLTVFIFLYDCYVLVPFQQFHVNFNFLHFFWEYFFHLSVVVEKNRSKIKLFCYCYCCFSHINNFKH